MNNNLIAIIVEGQTELAIMTLLLEKNALIYDEDDLLNGEIITTRKGNNFAKRYLNKGFGSRKIKCSPSGGHFYFNISAIHPSSG